MECDYSGCMGATLYLSILLIKGRSHKFLHSPYLYHGTDRGEGVFGRKARVQVVVNADTTFTMVHLAGEGGQSYLYRSTDRVNAETYETAHNKGSVHVCTITACRNSMISNGSV